MMPLGMWVVVGWMAFVALTGVVFLVWGWRRGQFRDIEEAKYRMLEEREPEPVIKMSATGDRYIETTATPLTKGGRLIGATCSR